MPASRPCSNPTQTAFLWEVLSSTMSLRLRGEAINSLKMMPSHVRALSLRDLRSIIRCSQEWVTGNFAEPQLYRLENSPFQARLSKEGDIYVVHTVGDKVQVVSDDPDFDPDPSPASAAVRPSSLDPDSHAWNILRLAPLALPRETCVAISLRSLRLAEPRLHATFMDAWNYLRSHSSPVVVSHARNYLRRVFVFLPRIAAAIQVTFDAGRHLKAKTGAKTCKRMPVFDIVVPHPQSLSLLVKKIALVSDAKAENKIGKAIDALTVLAAQKLGLTRLLDAATAYAL